VLLLSYRYANTYIYHVSCGVLPIFDSSFIPRFYYKLKIAQIATLLGEDGVLFLFYCKDAKGRVSMIGTATAFTEPRPKSTGSTLNCLVLLSACRLEKVPSDEALTY
jgi:hypothetical protein